MNPYTAAGLPTVINAAGKMTALGGTAQSEQLAQTLAAAARYHVDIKALRAVASARIAQATGASAGCVTSGAAAGLCIGAAAMISGTDLDVVLSLPDPGTRPCELVLQAGHDIGFGASVTQMLRVGGAQPVIAGAPDGVSVADLHACINTNTAGLVFVQSHHCEQNNRVLLAEFVQVAHDHSLPVLVDAAAEEDLRRYIAAGADLVTYSGGKALGGATVGFVAGNVQLIAAAELQDRGIARAMKVGKEQIMSLLAALAGYSGPPAWRDRFVALRDELQQRLAGYDVHVVEVPDRAGRDIKRVGLAVAELAGAEQRVLSELVRFLAAGDPSIRTRNHQLDEGLVLFDPRELAPEHVGQIANRVVQFFSST